MKTSSSSNCRNLSYIFWKLLLWMLVEIPAFAATLLLAALFGEAGAQAENAAGLLRYGRLLASVGGFFLFFALFCRILCRLKLGEMSFRRFVLLESAGYGCFLLLCCLFCLLTGGRCLTKGYAALYFLPQLPLSFLLQNSAGAFLPLLQWPLFALAAALCYRRNRRKAAARRSSEPSEETSAQ